MMSRIIVSIMVTYYRVKAILVILCITLRLFIRGGGCNNLDYNIDYIIMRILGLFNACTYMLKFDVVYIHI
jgi:hypothetical protein